MCRRAAGAIAPYILLMTVGLSASLFAEDFTFQETRPLMKLTAELRGKYGLLVTYEDAPTDHVTETQSEIHPNGVSFLFPKWKPITFHLLSGLPTRQDSTEPLGGPVDSAQSLVAMQDIVAQYNESGNPGKFSVTQDGQYLHIQQIEQTLNGKSQPFEPISNTVVSWEPKSESCQEMMGDLSAALEKVRGVFIADGSGPGGALLTHRCKVESSSPKIRDILVSLLDGLGTDNVTGKKVLSYTWDLVYDPNWNKYFLSFYLVSDSRPRPTTVVQMPPSSVTQPGPIGRLRHSGVTSTTQQH